MSLFAVLLPEENPKLVDAIQAKYPDNYPITSTQWIVFGKGTAREVSNNLEISTEKTIGSAVVLTITSYWGRASTDLWDWMRAKIEEKVNA
jgi:hypothetical protein